MPKNICKICKKGGVYNFQGVPYGIYCKEHKEPDMVDVINKKCSYENCNISASLGLPGHKRETCFQHSQEGYFSIFRTYWTQKRNMLSS